MKHFYFLLLIISCITGWSQNESTGASIKSMDILQGNQGDTIKLHIGLKNSDVENAFTHLRSVLLTSVDNKLKRVESDSFTILGKDSIVATLVLTNDTGKYIVSVQYLTTASFDTIVSSTLFTITPAPLPHFLGLSQSEVVQGRNFQTILRFSDGKFKPGSVYRGAFLKLNNSEKIRCDVMYLNKDSILISGTTTNFAAGKYDLWFFFYDLKIYQEINLADVFTISPAPIINNVKITPDSVNNIYEDTITVFIENGHFKSSDNYTLIFRKNDSTVFQLPINHVIDSNTLSFYSLPYSSPPGTYDVSLFFYENVADSGTYRHVYAPKGFKIGDIPDLKLISPKTICLPQWKDSTINLEIEGIFVDYEYINIKFTNGDTTFYNEALCKDKRIELRYFTGAPIGKYDALIRLTRRGVTKELFLPSFLEVTKGADVIVYSHSPTTLSQSQCSIFTLETNNAQIDQDSTTRIVFTHIETGLQKTFIAQKNSFSTNINLGYMPTGQYSVKVKYYFRRYLREIYIENALTLLPENKPVITAFSPATIMSGRCCFVKITGENIDYLTTAVKEIIYTRDTVTQRSDYQSIEKMDSSYSLFTEVNNIPSGIYSVTFKTSDTVYPEVTLKDAITIIPYEAPKIVSISKNKILQNTTQTITVKFKNISLLAFKPRYIFFDNHNYQIYATDIKVIDDETVQFNIQTSEYTSTGIYSVIMYDEYNYYSADSILLLKPENARLEHALSQKTVIQGQTTKVILTAPFETFTNLKFNACYVINSKNINIPHTVEVINDTVVAISISPSIYEPINELHLNLQFIRTDAFSNQKYEQFTDTLLVIYNPNRPKITVITPNEFIQGQKYEVDIQSQNTDFRTITELHFEQKMATTCSDKILSIDSFKIIDSSHIRIFFTTPRTANIGYYSLILLTNSVSYTFEHSIMVLKSTYHPELLDIDNISQKQGDTISITLKGKNIYFQDSIDLIRIKFVNLNIQWYANSQKVISNETILASFIIPDNIPEGDYDIWVDAQPIGKKYFEYYTLVKKLHVDTVPKEPRINDNTLINQTDYLTLYPSISRGNFTIVAPFDAKLVIMDINGKPIKQTQFFAGKQEYDITDLPSGVYSVIMQNNDQCKVFRYVKQ